MTEPYIAFCEQPIGVNVCACVQTCVAFIYLKKRRFSICLLDASVGL